MYRVEDKFVCTDGELLCLDLKLKTVLKTDSHQTNPNGYTITSVYFDDISDSHLTDTREGNRFREKYRIRIYNNSYETINLEVKIKRDNRVFKKSKRITVEQMKAFMQGKYVEDNDVSLDNAITLFNIAIAERKLAPVIVVEYERKAYIYETGNVRITIDRNLRYSDDIVGFMNQKAYRRYLVSEPNSVLEVKYDEFLPDFIAGLLENGNMRQSSYSKYQICREEVERCLQKI